MPRREPTLDERVQVLIGQIESAQDEKEQAAAFTALEKLGRPAVPYIIKRMDNRSPLNARRIVLENPSTTFETHRIYGPEQVVDALAAILNQMVGKNFGAIYNGGNGASRTMTVTGWRAWCRTAFPDVIDGCFP